VPILVFVVIVTTTIIHPSLFIRIVLIIILIFVCRGFSWGPWGPCPGRRRGAVGLSGLSKTIGNIIISEQAFSPGRPFAWLLF